MSPQQKKSSGGVGLAAFWGRGAGNKGHGEGREILCFYDAGTNGVSHLF